MKWLTVKNGKVAGAFAPRDDAWKRHHQATVKAGKLDAFLEVEDTEPATEGWLYQDGKLVKPEE